MVGTISFVEFTGLSAHYLVKMQNFTLKVMILNDGSPLKKVGEQIMLNIPSENLYFLGE